MFLEKIAHIDCSYQKNVPAYANKAFVLLMLLSTPAHCSTWRGVNALSYITKYKQSVC